MLATKAETGLARAEIFALWAQFQAVVHFQDDERQQARQRDFPVISMQTVRRLPVHRCLYVEDCSNPEL